MFFQAIVHDVFGQLEADNDDGTATAVQWDFTVKYIHLYI